MNLFAIPSVIASLSAEVGLKKAKAIAGAVAYTIAFRATAGVAFNIIFDVKETVPPVATVTNYFNVTSSMIYLTTTIKFSDGTTKANTNQMNMPGF